MIRTGVVGFGLAGQIFHAAVIRETPGLELACVVERSGKSAAAKYPGVRVVSSVEEMLADPTIQLCVVATPNHVHRSLAETCLRAQRHVVVDKPLALTSEDAAQLARIARECKVLLSAYHNRRWDGDFQTVRSLLESGRVGQPVMFESHFDRFRLEPKPGAWRETEEAGGGILYDLGPHLIDQALALFGPPATLWADVRSNRPNAVVDDAFDIALGYNGSHNGLRVWLRSSMAAASPGARFTLHGTGGSYEKWGLDPQEAALKSGAHYGDPGFGEEPAQNWGLLTAPGAPPETVPTLPGDYRKFYENVRDAILGRAELLTGVDLEQREVALAILGRAELLRGVNAAWSVARIIELARESNRSGSRLPVDLSPAAAL